jgi:hypothetical protein
MLFFNNSNLKLAWYITFFSCKKKVAENDNILAKYFHIWWIKTTFVDVNFETLPD